MGFLAADDGRPTSVRISITILHLVVAYLIFRRADMQRSGTAFDCLLAVPALVAGAWAFAYSPTHWSVIAQSILLIGTLIAIVSFVNLGRNFAILPAVRGIVTGGPYGWIRHPAYLGELLMIAGCCLAKPNWFGAIILSLAIVFVIVRINTEERLLGQSAGYQSYSQQVRWRLIPQIW